MCECAKITQQQGFDALMQHVCRSGVTLATMQARLVFSSGCLQGAPAAGAHNPARWHPQLTGCQQRHLHQARPSGGSAFSQQGSASVAACCSSAPSTSCASSVAVHSTSSRSGALLCATSDEILCTAMGKQV